MEQYRENNIEFRIASAHAISKFKSIQAHSFLQVTRKEFDFNLTSREVVLLCYERYSSWLSKIERDFLNEDHRTPSKELITLTIETFTQEMALIEVICKTHKNIFDTGVVELLGVIHEYSVKVITSTFKKILTESPSRSFVALADVLGDYLQHILIAMHEYNNNIVLCKEPFICVAKFSLLSETTKFSSIKARAEFFRQKIGTGVFLLKNYTDQDLSDDAIASLSDIGIFAKNELLETTS